MSESSAIDEGNTTQIDSENISNDTEQLDKESSNNGWVTSFKYLLPSSFRTKQGSNNVTGDDNVDVSSTFNPNSREGSSDPIFLEGSTFTEVSEEEKAEECEIDDDGVIDVECYVEEVKDNVEKQEAMVADAEESVADVLVQHEEAKSSKGWLQRLRARFRQQSNENNATAVQNTPFNETSSDSNHSPTEDTIEPTNTQPSEQPLNSTSSRRKRHKPIFHDLETNDIDTTTQLKQKKWSRRRKRAAIFVQTLKNAVFLFVVTFLAGNVMNQFVDLDEDGSFEVRFGKGSSSTSTSGVERGANNNERGAFYKKYRPSMRLNRPSTLDRSSQPLGLVAQAVQKVGPAVVRVETETDVLDSDATTNGDEDRGDIYDGIPEVVDGDNAAIDFGQGSGIIIRINDEFHILTNAHVVDGASRINVLLTDGRRFKAELVGNDEIVDVAVLKILPEDVASGNELVSDLPVAEFGDSDKLEVGTFVTAIGSPGGLDNSCTIGIVSGLKRCPKAVGIPDKTGVLQYIQTDAAINVGNSGGPLVDVESGDIVGINTCIRANMEGTSFAIPTNKVMGMLKDLYEGKHITHGYLGVQMSTVNPTLARYHNMIQAQDGLNLPEEDGVMIEKVFRKSPAATGGLKKYDFVSKIDGQKVANADDAHLIIDQAPIGQDLSLTILRGEEEIEVKVKPEDLSVRLKQLRDERLSKKKSKT
eukprot:scaffold111151_cov66-Cyclotella_meneghiniana.AAC.1